MSKYLSPGHVSIDGNLYDFVDGVVDIPDEVIEKHPEVITSFGLQPAPVKAKKSDDLRK